MNVMDGSPARWDSNDARVEGPLVKHSDDAIAMEGSVLRLLDSAILVIDDAAATEAFRHPKADTERHIDCPRERMLAHGASSSLVREAGGMVGALMKSLLDLTRSERAARGARDVYAAEHLAIAADRLLERIAIWAGDEDTAEVKRANCEDEERMVTWIDDHWNCLAGVALAERLTHA